MSNALRMRPDRIVVGECRGGEALDMLQAMNTGHDGSLTTCTPSARRRAAPDRDDGADGGLDLPHAACASSGLAVDVVAHVVRAATAAAACATWRAGRARVARFVPPTPA